MPTKDDINFMKKVYRNWGYYSYKAHKLAEEIKRELENE